MTNPTCLPPSSSFESRVLVWAQTRDARLTCGFLQESGLACLPCRGWDELSTEWGQGAAVIVLARELLDATNLDRLEALLAAEPPWSDPPLIVVAATGDPGDAESLVRYGNVSWLQRPVSPATLRSSVAAAFRARTRQYQVRDLLQQKDDAEQRKDEFLAMLAHELRNPLAPLRTGLQLVRLGPRAEVITRTYAMMDRQITHLSRLVDDLLDVSRITRRRIVLNKRPLDLRESLRQTVDAIQPQTRDKGLRLELVVPDAPMVIDGDAVRLDQMIGNVLGNAIKFTPPGGAISVDAGVDAEAAVISIRDTGVGIAADQVDKVFELFAQAPRSLDRAAGGLGVGLTVVKLVAELHDGSVRILSGDGGGTAVVIRLPLAAVGELTAETPATSATGAGARRRVLVIEDNQDAADTLAAFLAHIGHEVVVARDGHAGLEAALRHRPHVLLCDIGLPGLDGYQIASRLHGDERLTGCLMIAMTGYGDAADRERSSRAGFMHHITKPVDPEHLSVLIAAPFGGRSDRV